MSQTTTTDNSSQFAIDVNGYQDTCYFTPLESQCAYVPDNAMYDVQTGEITCLVQLMLDIDTQPYSDQLGVCGAIKMFINAKILEAELMATFWDDKVAYCEEHHSWIFWHCDNHVETCNMTGQRHGSGQLEAAALMANTIVNAWSAALVQFNVIEQTILDTGEVYDAWSTTQLNYAQLVAQVNQSLAEANLVLQNSEDKLLDLKNKELKTKAMYIIAPLFLLLGIALIFNK